jgi:hypothetical protein
MRTLSVASRANPSNNGKAGLPYFLKASTLLLISRHHNISPPQNHAHYRNSTCWHFQRGARLKLSPVYTRRNRATRHWSRRWSIKCSTARPSIASTSTTTTTSSTKQQHQLDSTISTQHLHKSNSKMTTQVLNMPIIGLDRNNVSGSFEYLECTDKS